MGECEIANSEIDQTNEANAAVGARSVGTECSPGILFEQKKSFLCLHFVVDKHGLVCVFIVFFVAQSNPK